MKRLITDFTEKVFLSEFLPLYTDEAVYFAEKVTARRNRDIIKTFSVFHIDYTPFYINNIYNIYHIYNNNNINTIVYKYFSLTYGGFSIPNSNTLKRFSDTPGYSTSFYVDKYIQNRGYFTTFSF